jgi:hypothetical protein
MKSPTQSLYLTCNPSGIVSYVAEKHLQSPTSGVDVGVGVFVGVGLFVPVGLGVKLIVGVILGVGVLVGVVVGVGVGGTNKHSSQFVYAVTYVQGVA